MSKFLDGTGLSDLITKIKNAFVAKADTTVVTGVGVDSTPIAGSTNLVMSGGVKAALDGKQDTISDLSTIRSGASAGATAYQKPSGGIPETDLASGVTDKLNATEIFWATYGTTTYEDVYAAYTAGKLCACVYSDKCYVLSMYTTDTNFYFTSGISGRLWYVRVGTNNSWFAGSYVLELTENKTSDVAGNSTSTSKYVTAKGVYDSLPVPNPTVPSGTTPTALTGLKIGPNYYGIEAGGGTVTDVTVGGTSVVNQQGVAEVPEIPEAVVAQELSIDSTPTANSANLVTSGGVASALSGKQATLVSGTNIKTINSTSLLGSGDITVSANTPKATTIPAGGLLPNIYYALGTLSGSVSITLAAATDSNILNHYFLSFSALVSSLTITWQGITVWANGSAPELNGGKHYEVSVIDGVGVWMETDGTAQSGGSND